LARKGNYSDLIDDVSQEIVAGFLADAEGIMARYASPEHYARSRAVHAAIDFLRRERVQRCEGVRLRMDEKWNVLVPVRVVVSGDSMLESESGDGDTTLWDVSWVQDSFDEAVVERLDNTELVDRLLSRLSDDELELVMLVWVDEYKVGEAAELMSIARETASRRLTKARQRLVAA
jgi:RNA polymerase sigma factor (sigma-70 family)